MARYRVPKAKPVEKDYKKMPWTEEFQCANPVEKIKSLMKNENISLDKLKNYLNFQCGMDRDKAELVSSLIENEVKIVLNDQEVNLTINIPFCLSRCIGCTNVMYEKQKEEDIYPYFIESLKKELELAKEIVKKKFYIVKNIIFTGNILALDEGEIEDIFKLLNYSLSTIYVELGSPKFVTKEKLSILKKYNVKSIIINQLSFNTLTLRKLCRKFEFKDLYESYKLILSFGFEVSFELVVGLLDEKQLQLKRNLEIATDLGATNIDLFSGHCKYTLEQDKTKEQQIKEQRKLLNFAEKELLSKGYKPYYLYCTEIDKGCFENVGFCIPGYANKYFIDRAHSMSTTIGCGTMGESLLLDSSKKNREVLKTTHSISQYVFGIEEILEKKRKLFGINSLQN